MRYAKNCIRRMTAVCLAFVMVLTLSLSNVNTLTVNAAAKSRVEIVKPDSDTTVLVLKKGQSYKLKTKVYNAKKKTLAFKSSKPSVVTVDQKGKLKAKKKGSATVTVSLKSNSKIKTKLKVKVGTKVKSIKLNAASATLAQGETFKISATLSPKKPSVKTLAYKTDNAAVATVSKNGEVTAVAEGTANITVKAQDGTGKKVVFAVTVTKAAGGTVATTQAPGTPGGDQGGNSGNTPGGNQGGNSGTTPGDNQGGNSGITAPEPSENGISLNKNRLELMESASEQLKVTSDVSVEWKSSNKTIATVDHNGKVTAVSCGVTYITAFTKDGKYAECLVTVKRENTGNDNPGGDDPGDVGGVEPTPPVITDDFDIPAVPSQKDVEEGKVRVGAAMPYTRYDSKEAKLEGGATLKTSANWAPNNIASQASEQSYVALPKSGAYAEWTVDTTGAGVTMRFTLPDGNGYRGVQGSLDVYVNGSKAQTVKLDSFWMWQYFNFGDGGAKDEGGDVASFAFDEVHFLLATPLKKGDKIRIQSTGDGGYEYGVDFLEIEDVPAPIEQPDNSLNIVDDCGAIAIDRDKHGDRDAFDASIARKNTTIFKQAVARADSEGMDLYIPEGTYLLDGMWEVGCKGVKITGAGIWYTNIQFTSEKDFGGGISGGNSTYVADGYCTDVEFSNMYINSGLRSRYGENAVYKCFMDVYTGKSVIHDIWEDHFECGFWIGDYNGKTDYSDGLKIINCRIRNNFADGVNFCIGTCNAAVYNCSVRNNGDDGLAIWNDTTGGAKDESNDVFAYNTIELGWRAGLLAIYGGTGHKVYNNYFCDSFMAAGIHLNSTFPGHKYANANPSSPVTFDNNILVRCGTDRECWNEDLAAIDIKQEVKNVTFNNTQIYDSPFMAIRLLENNYSGITFNNTTILGAGLSKQLSEYSYSSKFSGAAIREVGSSSAKFNGLVVGGIVADQVGNNTKWPYVTDNAVPQNIEGNATVKFENDVNYEIPSYPDPVKGTQSGGIVDALGGIVGYDLVVTGLSWTNAKGSSDINENDEVTFKAAIKNDSNVDIPEGVAIQLKVTVDGKGGYTDTSYKGGLKAGQTIILSPATTWTATAGGHTISAIADYGNKLPKEMREDNNTREKKFNVMADPEAVPTYTPVTGRYDIVVLDVTWDKEIINTGDELTFTATIVNAGDQPVPARKLGVQFQIDGQAYPAPITWNDKYYEGLQPGQVIKLTATGGNSGSTWKATTGTHTVTAWADDDNVNGEMNDPNNMFTKTITVPFGGIQYFDKVDKPDNLK